MSLDVNYIKEILIKKGFTLEEGLSDEEFEKIENFYSIKFPISLRTLYKSFLPIEFYNWRDFSQDNVSKIKTKLDWPVEAMLFDVAANGFWKKCFGPKTNNIENDKNIVINYIKNASNEIVPKLIPIYSHRYVPCYPDIMNMSVISVYQKDIIYYGYELEDYFKNEFDTIGISKEKDDINYEKKPVEIPFWTDIIDNRFEK
jgi:hypothetical protein